MQGEPEAEVRSRSYGISEREISPHNGELGNNKVPRTEPLSEVPREAEPACPGVQQSGQRFPSSLLLWSAVAGWIMSTIALSLRSGTASQVT